MNLPAESALKCEYREELPDGCANCGFLKELTGVTDPSSCEVSPEACEACLNWHRPAPQDLNPVVASLLYNFCNRALADGDSGVLPVERAARLKNLAMGWIPDEADSVSISDDSFRQGNLGLASPADIVPPPSRRSGGKVTRWAVGVTTAPRKQETLGICLDSLADAGWDSPRVFVDGETSLDPLPGGLPVTRRVPKIGAWPSWYLALAELLMRQPDADAYLMVQDDVVFYRHKRLRDYMESILWPDQRPGIVSMFCSRAYTGKENGWDRLDESLGWGGQALIFPREIAADLLSDPWVVRHRFSENGHAGIDGVVGGWAHASGVDIHLPTPSLVQHIGHVSSIWPGAPAFENRRAEKFAGSPPGARSGEEVTG